MIKQGKCLIKKFLPQRLISSIRSFVDVFIDLYSCKSYSQEGEDMVLRKLIGNQENGFYVDIGAHHPRKYSNTYYFYKMGWRGINIDAMPGSMGLFNKLRPLDINIEVAVSDREELLEYFIFEESALNSFSKQLADSYIADKHKLVSKLKLKTQPLEKILDEYLSPDQKIDFLSIDAEGHDLKVLKSNNWDKYSPRYVLIEILGLNLENPTQNKIFSFLKSVGYGIVSKCHNTVIFEKVNLTTG